MNIIIDLQSSNIWKIRLKIAINFISPNDVKEECVIHSKSENITFASYNNVNEVVDEL